MSKTYTIVGRENDFTRSRFEALYSNGQLIAESDDGPLTGMGVLDAIAMDNVGVIPAYIDITEDYDNDVVSFEGWPATLDDIPEDVRC